MDKSLPGPMMPVSDDSDVPTRNCIKHATEELMMLVNQITNTELQLEFVEEFLFHYLRTNGCFSTAFTLAIYEWDLEIVS